MGFFQTDIELLPSSRFDAGIDRWNKIYLDLKNGLIEKYGSAGKSPRTGNNMPAVPYAVAVSISVQFAVELSGVIALFVEQHADEELLIPQQFIDAGERAHMTPMQYYQAWLNQGHGEVDKSAYDWWQAFFQSRRNQTVEFLKGEVVRSNYDRYPNPPELHNPAYQRPLDANWRRIVHSGSTVVVTTDDKTEPERFWLRPAVRAYQGLIWNAWDCHILSAGGVVKPLTAAGADVFLKRIWEATQSLAIRIPSVTAQDVWDFTTARTSEVIQEAAGVAANTLDWATKTAAGAINEAVGELDIFTWLVLGSVGAVYLALM